MIEEKIFSSLNDAQREAVEVTSGPLLILAGAGSGKTMTLTHRIANLIANHGVSPNQILAVTFTNKAAREMRERLAKLLGMSADNRMFMPFMGTFHGICVRILKIEAENIGLSKNFVIYDEDDRKSLVKRVIKDLSLNDKRINYRAVSSVISKNKNEFRSASDYAESARYPDQKMIAEVFSRYETERRRASALDFDDLLLETARLFKERPDVREKWQQRFKHILIDEYQDTNAVQYQIVKLLVNNDQNICVVGDDWQSIYSWRGADFTNILNFEKDFPGAKVIKLEQNYRSTQSILDAASKVISKNKNRTEKEMWTNNKYGAPVHLERLGDETEEAFFVANRISTQVSMGIRKYSDFAILYRTNAQSYPFERIFMQSQVPYKIIGGVRFFDRKEIRDIMAYLKLIHQPNDIVSFMRIVNLPARGVGAVSLRRFLSYHGSHGNENDIIQTLRAADEIAGLSSKVSHSLVRLGNLLFDLSEKSQAGSLPVDTIGELVKRLDYKNYLNDGSVQGEDRIENIDVLEKEAGVYADLAGFLEDAALLSSSDESSEDDKVTLMTLHAAKGLEFPVVFLVGMEEGLLPHIRTLDFVNEDDVEEERRLTYVGMTRALEELFLSCARSRYSYNQKQYQMPSRFLEDFLDDGATLDDDAYTEIQLDDQPMVNMFEVGDRVESTQFGVGTITDIDGLAVQVNFDGGSVKKLNIEYARLKKL